MSDDSLNAALSIRLSRPELNLLYRLGSLRVEGRVSKHRGGYRSYEIEGPMVSEQDIWLNREEFLHHGLMTEQKITKFHSGGRREIVSLLDLTPLGLCMFFNVKAQHDELRDADFNALHRLINEGKIAFRSLNGDLMIRYLNFFDALPREFKDSELRVGGYLETKNKDQSLAHLSRLESAVDTLDKTTVSNFQVSQLYDLIDKLKNEHKRDAPRRDYIIIVLKVIRDVLAVSAGIVSAVLAYLAFFKA